MDFWRCAARKYKLVKVRNDRIQETEDMRSHQVKLFGMFTEYVKICLLKQIINWTPSRRRERGRMGKGSHQEIRGRSLARQASVETGYQNTVKYKYKLYILDRTMTTSY